MKWASVLLCSFFRMFHSLSGDLEVTFPNLSQVILGTTESNVLGCPISMSTVRFLSFAQQNGTPDLFQSAVSTATHAANPRLLHHSGDPLASNGRLLMVAVPALNPCSLGEFCLRTLASNSVCMLQ